VSLREQFALFYRFMVPSTLGVKHFFLDCLNIEDRRHYDSYKHWESYT